jgi:hypothetical protein
MKKLILLALILALPALGHTQAPTFVSRGTSAWAWDMDGEAADADQIVTVAALVDSTTYTVAAQPDICRLVDITVVDGDSSITAGVLTVTATGCLGEAKVCTYTFASGGSAVYNLTCGDAEGAYLSNVTSVISGVLTGEDGADTLTVGYTSNSVNGWPLYGTKYIGPNGEYGVDPFGSIRIPLLVTTSGASSTTVTGVTAAEDAFAQPDVGDIVVFTLGGIPYERKIITNADADTITINDAINIPATGITYTLRKFWYSSNPDHRMLMPVHGHRSLLYNWSVDANVNTGGVITLTQCVDHISPDWPVTPWVEIDTTTVASAGTQVPTAVAVNLETNPYQFCRFGFRFGTGDDGDGADEDINLTVNLMR